ncbi:MAG: uracil-DNA glycosylase [Clostridia bacterium]|nr:uracil-DNA glycosylase [Clostridia bacterium]
MNLDEIRRQCENCKGCELYRTRNNLVFGAGNQNADIFFIGEGPGENEDREGMPFVGRSGKLLDETLNKFGLSRDKNVYIANMVKCRPPENRDPKKDEVTACIGFLKAQIEAVNPKVVVCLGRVSASYFLGKDFKVTKQHGEFKEIDGRLFTATFHPAAILRNINNKPLFEEDIAKIKENDK